MKKMMRITSFLLALVLLLGMVGCGEDPAETTRQTQETTQATEPTEKELTPEEKILAERRDKVEQFMRELVSVRWKVEEDIEYQLATKGTLRLRAGRIYQGLPYTFAAGTHTSFLEHAGEPDENGVYTISGLGADALGGGTYAEMRYGNSCVTAVMLAWSQISDSITFTGCKQMHQKYGVYPVGDYKLEIEGDSMNLTGDVIMANGREKMYESYAQLQKGDAIVHVEGAKDHTAIVVSVDVKYKEDGTIDPLKSRIITLEQTRTAQLNQNLNNEIDPNEVFEIGRTDAAFTFKMLVQDNYLPVTCKELQDVSYEAAEPALTDTETELNRDTILAGTISCTRMFDAITMTITDASGAELQKITARSSRFSMYDFKMERFLTDKPATLTGSLDLEALTSGNYHCTVVCRLTNGQEITARDFDFTV